MSHLARLCNINSTAVRTSRVDTKWRQFSMGLPGSRKTSSHHYASRSHVFRNRCGSCVQFYKKNSESKMAALLSLSPVAVANEHWTSSRAYWVALATPPAYPGLTNRNASTPAIHTKMPQSVAVALSLEEQAPHPSRVLITQ
jgi:hypothetical protein